MKSKQIYLIRHGQTDFNKRGIVQGSGIDSDLNALGRAQAEAFYRAYHGIPFDKVYTSALKRSIQSVQRFLDAGLPWESHAGLNEINWGYREGKVITPEEDAYYYDVIRRWETGEEGLRIQGGESPLDVRGRQQAVLDVILSRREEEIVLICMHGRAMRILLTTLLRYPLSAMNLFEHHNLCLYKLHYTGSLFSVELFDDTAHLSMIDDQ
ncbi:MAG: histidine phosphatase family protein [Ferruginibacter sp.]|nr:histidine phosphatase family protein [Cytophagales bacterium]